MGVCEHRPACPAAGAPDAAAAHVVTTHPEQGWSLLCNGVVVFDDTGELLPGGRAVAPHGRPLTRRRRDGAGPRVRRRLPGGRLVALVRAFRRRAQDYDQTV